MKLTYFANWKSCLRTLVLTMMVIVAVLAVKPATVQAKASDYTQDTESRKRLNKIQFYIRKS